MNRKSRAKSSSLFLLELILAILFFSIASAVCVQIFVKSHLLSADAQALNLAVSECSGAAEVISASEGTDDAAALLQETYPNGTLTQADHPESAGASMQADVQNTEENAAACAFHVYYDEDMQPCAEKAAIYQMTILLAEEETMLTAEIRMTDDDLIYELAVNHHIQRRAGNE